MMKRIIVSILSRKINIPKSYKRLMEWFDDNPDNFTPIHTYVKFDSTSIYQGHKDNIDAANCNGYGELTNDSIIILCHDDLEIISNHASFHEYIELSNKNNVGWLGVAGCTRYDNLSMNGMWWQARMTGESRGFVFQGENNEKMTPNSFGPYGQTICNDGCFMACSYKTLKAVGLEKPHYLTSNWDFYDIHLTLKAHLMGLSNYTVPIIIRHESPGEMRKEWFEARTQFLKYHSGNLPCKIPMDKTHGLPK